MARKIRTKLKPLLMGAADDVAPPSREDAAEALFAPAGPDSEPATDVAPTAASPIRLDEASAVRFYRPKHDDAGADGTAPLSDAEMSPAPAPTSREAPRKAASDLPGWARSAYWIAVPAALLWAGAMAAFASGYQNPFGPFEYRPFPLVAFGALCLLPAVFILLAAYAVRQGAKLSAETRRARALADDMAMPAALAAGQAGDAAAAVRREVERAAAAAEAAEQQLLSLRRTLADESDRLAVATADAHRRAHELTESLGREREEMIGLTETLDAKVAAVTGAIAAQSRLVADASDLAAVQAQEAEAALAARATDLAAAAGEAGEAAQIVADVLAEQVETLEAAGETLAARIGGVQSGLTGEHARLSALAESLRADQEHIAARIEAQRQALLAASDDARAGVDELTGAAADSAETLRAQIETQRAELAAAAAEVRATAGDLTDASAQGAESLRALIASVAEQVGRLAADAEADQAAMSAKAQSNLKLFTGVVAEERAALEAETRAAIESLAAAAADTRKAAIDQTEAARDRVQQLGESAFALGQQTDQAFEARIGAAKRMIEQSAALIDDAGRRSAERIEAGVSVTHGALEELQRLLGDIELKVAGLPDEARARAETVRQAVEQGIGELTAAARKAAEDTQAIDAAFQGRIKHNYEMLSEALRLMGKVAGAADMAAKASTAPQPSVAEARKPLAAPPPSATPPPAMLLAARPEPAVNTALPETPRSIRVPPDTFKSETLRPDALTAEQSRAPIVDPEPRPEPRPEAAPPRGEGAGGEAIGLRPRLRLMAEPAATPLRPSPLAAEAPRPSVPAASPALNPPSAPAGDEWTWKDLLSSIDEPPLDDEILAERLISEIEALGLDAPALLPLSRIDELAVVMQAGDVAGARDVVRNLAPSAVRRLSRRVLTDKVLHAHADRYLQRYETLLADSSKRDRDGFVTATLLGSDPGRAFLLFNAAVGELH